MTGWRETGRVDVLGEGMIHARAGQRGRQEISSCSSEWHTFKLRESFIFWIFHSIFLG